MSPAEIWITGIDCSFKNIVKISSVFDFKWIAVTIDSVAEGSSLLAFVKDQGLKHFIRYHSAGYVEVSAVVPYPLFERFLDRAIKEDPENIFMINLLDPVNSIMYLQNSFDGLVSTGITNVFISISLDENALLVCINKTMFRPRELLQRLKACLK